MRYHAEQIETFAETEADLVSALTLTHTGEAIGIVRAAQRVAIPVAISFTVETDGRLPSGESLGDAIDRVDDATGGSVAYYMINCAPQPFRVGAGRRWRLDRPPQGYSRECVPSEPRRTG